MHRQGTLLTPDVFNPAFRSRETRHHGQQFHQFIMDMHDKLYKIESKQLLAKSFIGVFVWFNVALIVDQESQCITYFVNEGLNTPRWQHYGLTDWRLNCWHLRPVSFHRLQIHFMSDWICVIWETGYTKINLSLAWDFRTWNPWKMSPMFFCNDVAY